MDEIERLRQKYEALTPGLSEWMKRRWAAAEARSIGRGGATRVAKATGISLPTIRRGFSELDSGELPPGFHSRGAGAGRKRLSALDPTLLKDLRELVDPVTRGEPPSPLLWTSKSTTHLASELRARGHEVSADTVARLLHGLHYRLQAARKTDEGKQHPDRDAQFNHLYAKVQEFLGKKQPVISVDTKKKELIGRFKTQGREWQPEGEPDAVDAYDFPDHAEGKGIPYGVFDLGRNEGWVSVGVDHDTARFAVATIRRWWQKMGRKAYPRAKELLVTADSGGSNAARSNVWKIGLQRVADETGLSIHVGHFPPGTSKWNKIEHRMFSHITMNWRERSLVSYETVVNLIANTRTESGLHIQAKLDKRRYPTGVRASKEDLHRLVNLERDSFHGEWNYIIRPTGKSETEKLFCGGPLPRK